MTSHKILRGIIRSISYSSALNSISKLTPCPSVTKSNLIVAGFNHKIQVNTSCFYHSSVTFYKNENRQESISAQKVLEMPVETRPNSRIQGIQSHISPLAVGKRTSRKKKEIPKEEGIFSVTSYAAAEECQLEQVIWYLNQHGLYSVCKLPDDIVDAICLINNYKVDAEPRQIFIFREGSIVFWNVPEVERRGLLQVLRKYFEDAYDERLVRNESEDLVFKYADKSMLAGDEIYLKDSLSQEEEALHRYAFSNALSLSVKLGIWEASLSRYVDSIEWLTDDMRAGKSFRISQSQALQKTGELFALRHLINLSSDLLDTPDFYWDRKDLEDLYHKTCAYFSIARRTRVINEKLNYCCELTAMVREQLNQNHSSRLEWMIIILIGIEIVFEFLHYLDRYFANERVTTESENNE